MPWLRYTNNTHNMPLCELFRHRSAELGSIDRDLLSRVYDLYLLHAPVVTGQSGSSWSAACDTYDTNNNDVIDKAEVIVRAPSGTGVQAVVSSTCTWPWATMTSAWFSAETPGADYSGVFLLRCGFGDGTTNLEIWLRHRSSGQVFTSASYSGVMRQPWHDEDRNITYQIGCMPAATTTLDFVAGIREAARTWTNANARISFGRLLVPCGSVASYETGRVTVTVGTGCGGKT